MDEEMELEIPLDTLCRILLRAREYEAQVPTTDRDDGSNPAEDGEVPVVLEDAADDSVVEELRTAVEDLSEDEQRELVALVLIGRGTYEASEWEEALEAADDEADDVAEWLLDQPMLAALLDAGMAALDLSCDRIGQRN